MARLMVTTAEAARFQRCATFTRQEEGGFSDDVHDPGNWTGGRVGVGLLAGSNMGVTAAALARWLGLKAVTKERMRQLPAATFDAIALSLYWTPMGCGRLPEGVDLMVFDYGWNRGASTSLRLLQRVLKLPQDGICGPMTAETASAEDRTSLIGRIFDTQLVAYRGLADYDRYGKGWQARAERRQQAALAAGLVLT